MCIRCYELCRLIFSDNNYDPRFKVEMSNRLYTLCRESKFQVKCVIAYNYVSVRCDRCVNVLDSGL